jgi:hypothetical protein
MKMAREIIRGERKKDENRKRVEINNRIRE